MIRSKMVANTTIQQKSRRIQPTRVTKLERNACPIRDCLACRRSPSPPSSKVKAVHNPPEISFHHHEKDEILICDPFLLGECDAGQKCPQHHTFLPYHWQLRLRATMRWISLGPTAQEHLERSYCNVSTDMVLIENSDGLSSEMNLKHLSITIGTYDRARRLCNNSDPKINPYFPAKWRVCWLEMGHWKNYAKPISEELNASFEKGAWNHAFIIHGRSYNVDLKDSTQYNVKTFYGRDVRRRPIYRSYRSMLPYLKTVAESNVGIVVDSQMKKSTFPSTWTMQLWNSESAFLKVPMQRTEAEYTNIETCFYKTLSEEQFMIFAIYRIQNKFLWQKYTCQKEYMSQQLTNAEKVVLEKELYHGTNQDNVDQICYQNFDPRIAGINGTAYGKGSYFALKASYSHTYAERSENGYHYMFLAKVLIGKMSLGKDSYCRPPMLEGSYQLYDSCVDNLSHPKLFVVFDSCQCYPFYLIQYKRLSEPIRVSE